jgi:hypothetical protein
MVSSIGRFRTQKPMNSFPDGRATPLDAAVMMSLDDLGSAERLAVEQA